MNEELGNLAAASATADTVLLATIEEIRKLPVVAANKSIFEYCLNHARELSELATDRLADLERQRQQNDELRECVQAALGRLRQVASGVIGIEMVGNWHAGHCPIDRLVDVLELIETLADLLADYQVVKQQPVRSFVEELAASRRLSVLGERILDLQSTLDSLIAMPTIAAPAPSTAAGDETESAFGPSTVEMESEPMLVIAADSSKLVPNAVEDVASPSEIVNIVPEATEANTTPQQIDQAGAVAEIVGPEIIPTDVLSCAMETYAPAVYPAPVVRATETLAVTTREHPVEVAVPQLLPISLGNALAGSLTDPNEVARLILHWCRRHEDFPRAYLAAAWLAEFGGNIPPSRDLIWTAFVLLDPTQRATNDELGRAIFLLERLPESDTTAAWPVHAANYLLYGDPGSFRRFRSPSWGDSPGWIQQRAMALLSDYSDRVGEPLPTTLERIRANQRETAPERFREKARQDLEDFLQQRLKYPLGNQLIAFLRVELDWLRSALQSPLPSLEVRRWADNTEPNNAIDTWVKRITTNPNQVIMSGSRRKLLRDLGSLRTEIRAWCHSARLAPEDHDRLDQETTWCRDLTEGIRTLQAGLLAESDDPRTVFIPALLGCLLTCLTSSISEGSSS